MVPLISHGMGKLKSYSVSIFLMFPMVFALLVLVLYVYIFWCPNSIVSFIFYTACHVLFSSMQSYEFNIPIQAFFIGSSIHYQSDWILPLSGIFRNGWWVLCSSDSLCFKLFVFIKFLVIHYFYGDFVFLICENNIAMNSCKGSLMFSLRSELTLLLLFLKVFHRRLLLPWSLSDFEFASHFPYFKNKVFYK